MKQKPKGSLLPHILLAIIGLVGIPAMTLLGCSEDRWAEVRSDTDWSGYFDDHSVEGAGDRDVDLRGDEFSSGAVVQKLTREGVLRVRLVEEGWMFWPDQATDWTETSADFGVVHVTW